MRLPLAIFQEAYSYALAAAIVAWQLAFCALARQDSNGFLCHVNCSEP